MASPISIALVGNNLLTTFDNGDTQFYVPTSTGLYIPRGGTSNSDVGDNGGDGTSEDDDTDPNPDAPAPDDPDPVTTPTGSDLYNPWKAIGLSVGGDWETHVKRAGRGGADFPYGGGTPIKAPAAGTLHISGGSGEYAAGTIGSAGMRSILYLDKTYTRKKPRGSAEANGPMRAVVFQHQSKFGRAKHYNKGDIVGYTGNTGNGVYHLHVHGLDRGGSRVDFLKFL